MCIAGIARGCGWQHLGAYVNLGAYYGFGIPIAAILGFWGQLRGKGLWIGMVTGAFCQTVLLLLITICTNWKKQVCSWNSKHCGSALGIIQKHHLHNVISSLISN